MGTVGPPGGSREGMGRWGGGGRCLIDFRKNSFYAFPGEIFLKFHRDSPKVKKGKSKFEF